MSKKIILIVIVIIVLGGIGYLIYQSKTEIPAKQKFAVDARNASYTIEGEEFTLVNGRAEKEIVPDSISKTTVLYFGNDATGDLNGDGRNDVAFLITQNNGGSGAFYYVAVALNTEKGYQGTNAILLGDRIAPQTTEIRDGKIIVNYADRRTDEIMVIPPSIGITKQFALEGITLKDVTPEEAKKEQSCVILGGTIKTSLCCKSSGDFPNLCLIGACGCSPTNSHQIKTCDCGKDKCFNGEKCVATGG